MKRPHVVVYHPQESQIIGAILAKKRPDIPLTVVSQIQDLEAIDLENVKILLGWQVPMAFLQHWRSLRWIQSFGAGVDTFITLPSIQTGQVILTRIIDLFNAHINQYVFAHILYDLQCIELTLRLNKQARWAPFQPTSLQEKTLGLVGLGSIGQSIAQTANIFNMPVIGWSRSQRSSASWLLMESLEMLLARADFVVVALPLTPQTENLITLKHLQQLKPEACLINVGRGHTLNEADLLTALDTGIIRKLVLDVFQQEPLPSEHPFWRHDKVIVTPHISGLGFQEEIVDFFLKNYDRFCANQPLQGEVIPAQGY